MSIEKRVEALEAFKRLVVSRAFVSLSRDVGKAKRRMAELASCIQEIDALQFAFLCLLDDEGIDADECNDDA